MITAFASLFNLYTINWLLGKLMTALVVALPIVFQPELRRALEKLGRGKFLTIVPLPFMVMLNSLKLMLKLPGQPQYCPKTKWVD